MRRVNISSSSSSSLIGSPLSSRVSAGSPLRASPDDLGEQYLVQLVPIAHEASPGRPAAQIEPQRGHEEKRRGRTVGEAQRPAEAFAETFELRPLVDAEDGAQDDL